VGSIVSRGKCEKLEKMIMIEASRPKKAYQTGGRSPLERRDTMSNS
jgi:hypothetical protein